MPWVHAHCKYAEENYCGEVLDLSVSKVSEEFKCLLPKGHEGRHYDVDTIGRDLVSVNWETMPEETEPSCPCCGAGIWAGCTCPDPLEMEPQGEESIYGPKED